MVDSSDDVWVRRHTVSAPLASSLRVALFLFDRGATHVSLSFVATISEYASMPDS